MRSAAPSESTVAPPDAARREAVVIRGLTKRFGDTTVLRDVDLTIEPGEIHALVGQNGSGKSTVIKILSGVHTADEGGIVVGGRPLSTPVRPTELRHHSLAFVHQDLGLVDDLTVLENVRVGHYATRRLTRKIDWVSERSRCTTAFARLGASIPLDARAGVLTPGQRAVVAIARALQGQHPGTGCIVFDESTQSLPRETLPEFYDIVRAIARSGTGILLVSHRLDEVLTLADRVTVLRDGVTAAEGVPVRGLTESHLSRLILGRELASGRIDAATAPGVRAETVLRLNGVRGRLLPELDLEVRGGEVVGITGAGDTGLAEFGEIIAGDSPHGSGALRIADREFTLPEAGCAALLDAGLAVVPQNRMRDGLAAELSALENVTLPRAKHHGRAFLARHWQRREFTEAVRSFGITPGLPQSPVAAFSGGNQQKLLLAKWLLNKPKALVACEPTQAVDVGARLDILRALRAAADEGRAVLICSIEVQDLAAVCDRVVVLRAGGGHAVLDGEVTAEAITRATYA